MSEDISLIIKSVNQSSPDHRIECNIDLTVLSLKDIIHKVHPATPKVAEQKLIYFGQLLSDDQTLKSALRHPPENNLYTLHLVYPNQKPPARPETSTDSRKQNTYPNTMESTGARRRTVNESSTSQAYPQGQNPLNYNSNFSQFYPTLPADPTQQMAAFQQMYAQYMATYFQYLQTGAGQSFPVYQGASVATNQTPPSVSQSASTTDRAAPVPEPENNEERQEAVRNAGNGIFGEDEPEERGDWLDYIYCISRFCVLLSIVYFYSSAQRLVSILAVCFFLFMYQQNVFGQMLNFLFGNNPARPEQNVAGAANNNANIPREPTEPTPSDDQDETQSEESSAGEQTADAATEVGDSNNAVEVRDTQHSIIALSWIFITGFFSSLIPDNREIL